MKKIIAFLLSPISMLYGMGVSIHQSLYYSGFFKSVKFSIPIINIGNLSVGGTGKSPHIEYILKMIHDYLEVGVISRGYRRKSSGYILLAMKECISPPSLFKKSIIDCSPENSAKI